MSLPDPDMAADTADELDVRLMPKSQRHPMIFARFDALAPGESFVLVKSHDPIHLRQEFARDRPPAGINDHPDPAHVGIIALRGLAQSQ